MWWAPSFSSAWRSVTSRWASLRLLATKRSAGRQLAFRGEQLTVRETTHDAFDGADIAFISASTAASKELCPRGGGTRRDRVR